MIEERNRHKFDHPIYLNPGDVFNVSVKDPLTGETVLAREEIGRHIMVTGCVTFNVTKEFGVEDGIGVVIGKLTDD